MDEFYLSEEVLEWLGLKKSEYLSRLIENMSGDDVPFEDFTRYDDLIPSTLSRPDWSIDTLEDNQRVKTFCRTFGDPQMLHQVVIGALVPDQNKNDVFIPILTFVTKNESLVNLFTGGKVPRPILN